MSSRFAIKGIREIGLPSACIFPETAVRARCAIVYHNIDRFSVDFSRHLAKDVYASRVAECDKVSFVRYPPRTIVNGGDFITLVGAALVKEQCHPAICAEQNRGYVESGRILESWKGKPVIDVDSLSVVLARYGFTAWGHWLLEIFPRALITERLHPKKFTFMLPSVDRTDPYVSRYIISAIKSLEDIGIDSNRIRFMRQDALYRFSKLHAVTSVWSEPQMMHPGVVDALRHIYKPAPKSSDRIFLVRDTPTGRKPSNEDQIRRLCTDRGYKAIKLPDLSMSSQAQVFSKADIIVSTLGSDLSGLIYAPDGVKVLSMAPSVWGDRFFYALIQLRQGVYADLRGDPVAGSKNLYSCEFRVDPDEFEDALNILEYIDVAARDPQQ